MSDIRNNLTGRVFKQIDNTLAELMVDTGSYSYHRAADVQAGAPQQARPTAPTFALGRNAWGKLTINYTTTSGNIVQFAGTPEQARDAFKAMAWSAKEQKQILQGPDVPQDLLNEYAMRYNTERRAREKDAALINEAGQR
jgi:hypothetical protein